MVIARTDARAVIGFEEAIARANAAVAAGADMIFVEAPATMEEIAAVPKRVNAPCLLNVVWGGKSPDIDLRDAEAMGYKFAILPGLLFKAAIGACDAVLQQVKEIHRHPTPAGGMTVHAAFNRVGAEEWGAYPTRFRAPNANPVAVGKASE